jgi:hypothetical protein
MPVHDWKRVNDGTFHDFHASWITHIKESLNEGILPPDYYAQAEQVATRMQTDILALHTAGSLPESPSSGGLAILEAAPRVRLRARPASDTVRRPRRRRRRVVVRHISGHRVVAVIEIVSPANKDREGNVRAFADKVEQLLRADIQVMVVDLLPPGRFDPQGMHAAVWLRFDSSGYSLPESEPLTLASYRWDESEPEAFIEPTATGRALTDMPLFLNRERYVNLPLEPSYQATYAGIPAFWRRVLEGGDVYP